MVIVHKTDDYSQFKFFKSNRNVSGNSLVKSIQQKNMLASHPMIVTPKKGDYHYVIDGQHRLKAAEFLKVPIYYIIDDKTDEEDLPRHQIQRSWELHDYLKYYKGHNDDYEFINKIVEEGKLPVHQVVRMCSGLKDPYSSFRDGTYKLKKNRQQLIDSFNRLLEINDICSKHCEPNKILTNGIYAIWKIIHHPKYIHSIMLTQCEKHKDEVIEAFGLKDIKNIYSKLKYKVYNKCKKATQLRDVEFDEE